MIKVDFRQTHTLPERVLKLAILAAFNIRFVIEHGNTIDQMRFDRSLRDDAGQGFIKIKRGRARSGSY